MLANHNLSWLFEVNNHVVLGTVLYSGAKRPVCLLTGYKLDYTPPLPPFLRLLLATPNMLLFAFLFRLSDVLLNPSVQS